MRIAFDIGGVLSKHPQLYLSLIRKLLSESVMNNDSFEVFVITDMDRNKALDSLRLNDFLYPNGPIYEQNVLSADYSQHGEMCKDVLLKALGIDIFFDDFVGYVVGNGAPVRLLVMPDAAAAYYHDDWKTPDEASFGRVVSNR